MRTLHHSGDRLSKKKGDKRKGNWTYCLLRKIFYYSRVIKQETQLWEDFLLRFWELPGLWSTKPKTISDVLCLFSSTVISLLFIKSWDTFFYFSAIQNLFPDITPPLLSHWWYTVKVSRLEMTVYITTPTNHWTHSFAGCPTARKHTQTKQNSPSEPLWGRRE